MTPRRYMLTAFVYPDAVEARREEAATASERWQMNRVIGLASIVLYVFYVITITRLIKWSLLFLGACRTDEHRFSVQLWSSMPASGLNMYAHA